MQTLTNLRAVQHASASEGSAVVARIREIQSRIATSAEENVQERKNKDVSSAVLAV
jgi:hypothetical protein